MDEYISKAELYRQISELEESARNRYLDTPSNSPAYPRYMAQMDERTQMKHLVSDFPAADVAPVVHGRWTAGCVCSACGDAHGPRNLGESAHYHYCPNCGAKIDGGDEK